MYSATFIFEKKQFDAHFHHLDGIIADAAKATDGYIGEESWENTDTGRVANVYYWESEAGLEQLMRHPSHLAAKEKYATWLSAYQVVISQVLRAYGDHAMAHPTTAFRAKVDPAPR